MKTIVRTTDPILISRVRALLRDGGVESFVLDENVSNLYGSAGVVAQSVSVVDDDYRQARRLVAEADLAHELEPEEAAEKRGFFGFLTRRWL